MTDEERQEIIKALRSFAHDEHSLLSYAADELERLTREREMLLNSIYRESERAQEALAQSNAEPGPDSILHELGECPAQSNAEPQTLRDAAENLLIAIGMGWDIEGCVENLRAALAQSNTEPASQPTEPGV